MPVISVEGNFNRLMTNIAPISDLSISRGINFQITINSAGHATIRSRTLHPSVFLLSVDAHEKHFFFNWFRLNKCQLRSIVNLVNLDRVLMSSTRILVRSYLTKCLVNPTEPFLARGASPWIVRQVTFAQSANGRFLFKRLLHFNRIVNFLSRGSPRA